MYSSILFVGAAFARLASASYVLQDNYTPSSFFSMFNFFTAGDPTNGFFQYVDQPTAQSSGLINTNNNQIYIGVDYTNVASNSGRKSVRIVMGFAGPGLHIMHTFHIFDDTFCGDWAGNVWSSTPYCASLANTRVNYVQNNLFAFTKAYWLINSLKVYQSSGTPAKIKPSFAAAAHHEPVNATAPIDTAPLAMGGGLAPKGRYSRRFNDGLSKLPLSSEIS